MSHNTGEDEHGVTEKLNSPVVQACRLNLKHPEQAGRVHKNKAEERGGGWGERRGGERWVKQWLDTNMCLQLTKIKISRTGDGTYKQTNKNIETLNTCNVDLQLSDPLKSANFPLSMQPGKLLKKQLFCDRWWKRQCESGAGICTAFVAGWAAQVRHKAQRLLVTKAFTGSAEPSAVQVAIKKLRACGAH